MDGETLELEVTRGLTAAYERAVRLTRSEESHRDVGAVVALQCFLQRVEAAYLAYRQREWSTALDRLLDARKAIEDLAPDAPD